MSDIAIRVENLTKDFEVYAKPSDLALEVLTGRKRHRAFRALDNVSFEVRRGEVLGVIGSNGAGKSTLLKIVTGVLDATEGSIEIAGKVTAILELGLGFNPEYSGRENIYLSGLLYGMDRAEVDRKLDSIVAFSGLEAFMDQPVKNYSSGMHSRLAFSIATAVDPDILIIDEALAAGDAMFVQKCLHRIQTFCRSGHTVLVVSHGTGILAQLCRRVMWLEHGKVREIGPALNVIQAYDLAAHQGAGDGGWLEQVDEELGDGAARGPGPDVVDLNRDPLTSPANRAPLAEEAAAKTIYRKGPIFIERVEMWNAKGEPASSLRTMEPFRLSITYRCDGEPPEESLGVALAINQRYDLMSVAQWFTQNIRPGETREEYEDGHFRVRPKARGTIVLDFPYMPFRAGEYILSLGLLPNLPGNWLFYEYRHLFFNFSVDDGGLGVGAPMFLAPAFRHMDALESLAISAPRGGAAKPAIAAAPEIIAGSGAVRPTTLREEIQRVCFDTGGYPDTWPRHECCPACGDRALFPHFRKYGLNHSRCGACGFLCVDPYPPPAILQQLYEGDYYTNVREFHEYPRLIKGEGGAFSLPRPLLEEIVIKATEGRAHGRWLDVGGGIGAFARLIGRMRPNWDVFLNELNPRSREIAATAAGVAVVGDEPEHLAEAGKTYDTISAMAVLEHCPDPASFLRGYLKLLRPGGLLIVGVPAATYLTVNVSRGSSANIVPPFHVSMFGESNLRLMLERLGVFSRIDITQHGEAAFLLHEHVAYGDHWDIAIPTPTDPAPRSIRLQPYTPLEERAINELDAAGRSLSEFFAETDGRDTLVAFATLA